jgi:hypothetical protein
MGLFDDSAAALAGVFADAAGETVHYARGDLAVDPVAWRSPEPATLAVDSGAGALIEYESWEWHLGASALGSLAPPQPGDRITAADGRVYEVLRVPGLGCYAGDALLRVHTKRIEA